MLTLADAAKALKVSERTIRREIADGRLVAIQIRGLYRIRPDDLTAYLAERPTCQPAKSAGNALTTGSHLSLNGEDWIVGFQPRTGLGKKLLALRQAYVASGGKLMSATALDDELRDRRGGVDDA